MFGDLVAVFPGDHNAHPVSKNFDPSVTLEIWEVRNKQFLFLCMRGPSWCDIHNVCQYFQSHTTLLAIVYRLDTRPRIAISHHEVNYTGARK